MENLVQKEERESEKRKSEGRRKNRRNMVVSLIGRPNVGKSSLFNLIMGRQYKSITFDSPGVTRDRHYGIATLDLLGREEPTDIILVDTGGFYPEKIEETQRNRDKFFNIMADHAKTAIGESDLVLMIVDVREGALPFDSDIAQFIRSQEKEFWVVINKYDSEKQKGSEADFYEIPSDDYFLCSAAHNYGVRGLKEKMQQRALGFSEKIKETHQDKVLLSQGITPREDVVARLSLIGAPNAGKSTLLNLLVGAKRALVSDIPGTTVDPIEGYFDLYFGEKASALSENLSFRRDDKYLFQQYEEFRNNNPDVYSRISESYQIEEEERKYGEFFEDESQKESQGEYQDHFEGEFEERPSLPIENSEENDRCNKESEESYWRSLHLVDTAGIRRKSNIRDFVESQSVFRSLRCISESDIIIFLVDALKGIGHQDRRLMDIALEKGKSLIICMNKFDLLKEKFKTQKEYRQWHEDLYDEVPWLKFCDIIALSAKEKTGIKSLKKSIVKTIFVRSKKIATGELNRFVYSLVERNPVIVSKSGGKRLKVKYVSQVKSDPPTFLFFVNRSKGIPENYKRYLKNGLRRNFEFYNTPLHLLFRTGSDLEKRMAKVKN